MSNEPRKMTAKEFHLCMIGYFLGVAFFTDTVGGMVLAGFFAGLLMWCYEPDS